MAFREVSVVEVCEVLRGWWGGGGLRTVVGRAGVDRKTARRCVAAAEAAGVCREGGLARLTDEVIGQVVAAVRPARAGGHGHAWDALEAEREQISEWVGKDLSVVKIADLLTQRGVLALSRALHRFCTQRCGFGRGGATTVRVADGEPGVQCQIDFAKMGLVCDPGTGRRRVTHALISRRGLFPAHGRVVDLLPDPSRGDRGVRGGVAVLRRRIPGVDPRQRLGDRRRCRCGQPAVHRRLAGLHPALRVFHRRRESLPARKTSPVWSALSSTCGGTSSPARTSSTWPTLRPGRRSGAARPPGCASTQTIAARPAEVFAECEAPAPLPVPNPYDVPIFTQVTVHRDFHIEVGKALYSAPRAYLGEHLDVRANSALVKLFCRGQLVKAHPRARPGARVTDPEELPEHKAGYAPRDLDRLVATAGKHGPDVGIHAQRLLDDTLPWTKMRQVYRLLGLARRYGDTPVNTACARALALDVVSVTKIASMLEQASENTPPPPPRPATAPTTRFARDPAEFNPKRPTPTPLNGSEVR